MGRAVGSRKMEVCCLRVARVCYFITFYFSLFTFYFSLHTFPAYSSYRARATQAFVPPKPKELERATRMGRGLARLAT